jgi:hypothetical protein
MKLGYVLRYLYAKENKNETKEVHASNIKDASMQACMTFVSVQAFAASLAMYVCMHVCMYT